MSAFSPEPSPEPELITSFPLFSLPPELILKVVAAVNERDNLGELFPKGPNVDILQLSQTNKYFAETCLPLIWYSIKFTLNEGNSGVRPQGYRKIRSLNSLVNIIKKAQIEGRKINIKLLSVNIRDDYEQFKRIDDEIKALNYLLTEMKELKVVFLEEVLIENDGADIINSLSNLSNLTSLRLNQVDLGYQSSYPSFPQLKSLQLMHGSVAQLVRTCPNLESLLVWSETRRLGSLETKVCELLSTLKFLSLDVVEKPGSLMLIAQELKRMHTQQIPIPLTELFVEGYLKEHEYTLLLESLAHTSIKRLALYHLKLVTPKFIGKIVDALPNLEALTLVQGETHSPVPWPAPFEEYLSELSRFKKLKFYASDRMSPPNADSESQSRREFESFRQVGAAVPSLEKSVAILHDVSEGATAYFALFEKVGNNKTKLNVKKDTVKDFLINFKRWCLLEE